MAVDIFRPELWNDFFMTVGGAAAALTGLVFVALSLNIDVIAGDATHRYRAIGTLAGLSATFMTCALILMGNQDHTWVGVEWLVIGSLAGIIYVYGYVQATRMGGSVAGLSAGRLVASTALYVAQIAGAILLVLGYIAGLYVAAVAMIILLAWGFSGAWLLVIGVQHIKAGMSG